jgi:cullin 1
LIAEVVSQISQRFTPKIGDIKKAIETLLEKEYIERAEGQRDVSTIVAPFAFLLRIIPQTYNYLA